MYDSTKDSIPLMDQKGSTSVVNLISDEEFLNNPFGFDKGNNQFWDNVSYLKFTLSVYYKKCQEEKSSLIVGQFRPV